MRAALVRFCQVTRKIEGVTLVTTQEQAYEVLQVLGDNKDKIHAWDTRLTDEGSQSPARFGRLLCASCYIGHEVNFGAGSKLLVDNMNGKLIQEFKDYFEDADAKKIFHNYSRDRHVLAQENIMVKGFVADTWHLSRLVDSSLGSWEFAATNEEDADEEAKEGHATAVQENVFVREGPGEILSKQPTARTFSTVPDSEAADEVALQPLTGLPAPVPVPKKKKVPVNHGGYNLENVVKQFKIQDVDTSPTVKELLKKAKANNATQLHTQDNNIFDEWVQTVTNDAVCTLFLYKYLESELGKKEWHTAVHQDSAIKGSEEPLGTAKLYTGKTMLSFNETYYRYFAETLCEIEAAGLPIDVDFLQRAEKVAQESYVSHMTEMFKWARPDNPEIEKINIRSTRQVRQLLFGKYSSSWDPFAKDAPAMNKKTSEVIPAIGYFDDDPSLPKKQRILFPIVGMGLRPLTDNAYWTPSGWPSVNRESLSKMRSDILKDGTMALSKEARAETAEGITNLRDAIQARFMITSYIRPLQRLTVLRDDGARLYPILMMDTSTGRLVCKQPNLQSMPSSNDPFHLRKAIRARPGNVILACDYSQLELRVLADHSNCKSMIDTIVRDGDIHSDVAAAMVPEIRKWADENPEGCIKDQFPKERKIAKTLNFGIAYGITSQRVARALEMSEEEALEMVDKWYADKQEIKEWKEKICNYVSTSKNVPSLLGRCRTLPLVGHSRYARRSKRAAINHCVQGSAADICMAAMISIHLNTELRDLGFRMILQVHDEILLEGPQKGSTEALKIVKQCMESPFKAIDSDFKMSVPLKVDGGIAETWYDAKGGGN